MGGQTFDISVMGEMGPRLRAAFEDVDVTVGRGVTRLRVVCRDTAVLHGIIDRIASFGLELLDVHPVDEQSRS